MKKAFALVLLISLFLLGLSWLISADLIPQADVLIQKGLGIFALSLTTLALGHIIRSLVKTTTVYYASLKALFSSLGLDFLLGLPITASAMVLLSTMPESTLIPVLFIISGMILGAIIFVMEIQKLPFPTR